MPKSGLIAAKYRSPSRTSPPCTQAWRTASNVTEFGVKLVFLTMSSNMARASRASPCTARHDIIAVHAVASRI
ncbi:hypothetical protein IEQ34_009867 [Dendrobium chrysotoxum]|uniref:Uncharacterized protein n=1 Tax=Dendrobium chrysotoxum TaxID=161865 RepID=A0AAV7H1V1_DENCH|nr:hypothetical protein IEQ34_009867 [Dendrobium chrysotoxum]